MESVDNDILFSLPPFFRQYKNGQIERLTGQNLPAGLDPSTGVTTKDLLIDPSTALSARLYLPSSHPQKLPILLDFHGGAFLVGSAFDNASHPINAALASQTPAISLSVDYRLAPEHPLPAAYHDGWAALHWLASQRRAGAGADEWLAQHADFDRVFLVGGSAGANIAHNVALRAGVEGGEFSGGVRVEGLILLHPYFWGSEPIGSESADVAFREREERLWRYICPGTRGLGDPLIDPLAPGAPGLESLGCQRVFVAVAEKDWLRERGIAYYEALKGGSKMVELLESEGVGHGFFVFDLRSERSVELIDRVVDFIKRSE